ncbi:Initiation-specific alpha-1,6-mannosyltransferase [Cytospora mali]|uniref:Initiation-specific alpha-1,6-mannosyltransferase n=1 Tax=Cytospora mali TaxID=578113 RepID=A0A194VRQ9_CYTMA|nr:Initiation-specific alpha-1,6-mannosyltransferase [Valsa mali]
MPQPQQPTPPEELAGIPKKIWYKLGPKGLNDDTRKWTETCITQNPQYHAEFLTDQSADEFVRNRFSDRPDIVDTYMALTVPILKADLLRYLILYAEGGVWFDLDVSCEGIPIDDWIPEQFRQDANLMVGWEFDAGYHFAFDRQFTTWTVLARKGVGHLMAVVDDIVRTIGELAEVHGVPIAGLKVDMVGDIVDLTGPRRFEQNVIESLERSLNKTDGWDEYYEILEPKMVGDVVILPGYALCASFNTYEGQDSERVGPSLVTHHYAGSWKNENGGEVVEDESQRA